MGRKKDMWGYCFQENCMGKRNHLTSNYNRASGLAVWPCVWKPTPITADVTVTKIAGYVRVRILMNLWFFVFLVFILFYAMTTFYTPGAHALNTCTTRAEPCDWSAGAPMASQQCWGVSLRDSLDTTQVMLGVSLRARWDTTLVILTT